jgi:type VI protein secretion system component Hcp
MPMQKKSINKVQKNAKKAAGTKARATRLSGKSVTATQQMNMTKTVDASSPTRFLLCTGGH